MLFWICFLLIAIYVTIKIFTNKKSDSVACLVGKTAVITGGNSGIGYATSILLASRGCRIIIADKDDSTNSCEEIQNLTGNKNVISKYLNLASLTSIREFAQDLKKHETKIDILINNAGIGILKNEQSEDGLNLVMQINFFGAFLLTHLVVDLLKKSGSSRVIFVTSSASLLHNLTLENFNNFSCKKSIDRLILYANSKLCNALAGQEFAKRLKKYGISCNSADPWIAKTAIFKSSYAPDLFTRIWLGMSVLFRNSAITSAQTSFHLASSEALEGVTGQIFMGCRRSFIKYRVLKNEEFCRKIWERSEELVRLKPEEKLTLE